MSIPDRVRRNITVTLTGLMCLESWARVHKAPFPKISVEFVQEQFVETLESLINVSTGRTQILADELVEDVINEASRSVGVDPQFVHRYAEKDNILWFHLSTSLSWWYKHRRSQNRSVLDSAAIKSQLKERMVADEDNASAGQYIIGRKPITIDGATRHCYGIKVDLAISAGLDIPETLAAAFYYTVSGPAVKKEA